MAKVLIVDDSGTELTQMRNLAESAGWNAVTASNGSEAVSKAQAEKPNLILLDIIMPGMDGFETCRQLQADPATRDIPVVFVSSKNQKADQMWAKMQGGKTLIGKPYEPAQILDALKAYG